MSKRTLASRKEAKIKRTNQNITLNIDYESVDKRDTYAFYLTNKATKNNPKQLPDIGNFVDDYPDFFALDSEPGLFHKTEKTCVCFFKEENYIDRIDGLNNAIKYKEVELIKYYKTRYRGVKYFTPVDYSLNGDFDEETLLHNLKRQCIDFLWFTFEMDGVCFPIMTYGNEASLSWCFEHIMKGSNIVISLKMVMTGLEKEMFLKALKVLVDTREPKALLIYSVASHDSTMKMLDYAMQKGIKIIEIPNTLMVRNRGGK